MLIDIENEHTFPIQIKRVVFDYCTSLPEDLKRTISQNRVEYSSDVATAFEFEFAQDLYNLISDELNNYSLTCYHFTKVIDVDSIRNNGILSNSWKRYSDNLAEVLQKLDIRSEDINESIALVWSEYNRKYRIRHFTPQICFFSSLKLKDIEKGNCFCENIGGELARRALEYKKPLVYETLVSNGVAVVVKVALPWAIIAPELRNDIAKQFILYFVAKFFWDFEYEMSYDCYTKEDIPSHWITEIIALK